MKKRYGEDMSETIFEELKAILLNEQRLLSRFYEYCLAYQNFEFDEMGLNMDEADEEKRKALKIKEKLISTINEKFEYTIKNNSADILNNTIQLDIEFEDESETKLLKYNITVEEDGFSIEILE